MSFETTTQPKPQPQTQKENVTLWKIDPAHSSVNFSIRHMMFSKVNGGFSKFSGNLRLDNKDPSKSSVDAFIETASIDTREDKRDEHLRSAEFFDAQKYPTIEFRSKRVERNGEGIKVIGDLDLHGVTKEVALHVEGMDAEMKDPTGKLKMAASATTKIRRKEFGLNWNAVLEAGGVLVGDEVNIAIDVQFIKQA
jgi:polyisoprenoid-binding protein YceI